MKNKSIFSKLRRSMNVVKKTNESMMNSIENASDDSVDYKNLFPYLTSRNNN